jgi:hypothetical protein
VRAIYPYDLNAVSLPLDPQCSFAITTGTATAQINGVDNCSPSVINIQTGKWDWKKREFIPCCSPDPASFPNAVTVSTQRADVPLYFMQILGAKPRTLGATSTAVMDWVGAMKKRGGLGLALGEEYAKSGYIEIPVNDDNTDKGGWYACPPLKPTDKLLMDYLYDMDFIPYTATANEIYLQNGVCNNVLRALADDFKGATFFIPIVDKVKFNQNGKVVGFSALTIEDVRKIDGKHTIVGNARILAAAPPGLAEPGGSEAGAVGNKFTERRGCRAPPFLF